MENEKEHVEYLIKELESDIKESQFKEKMLSNQLEKLQGRLTELDWKQGKDEQKFGGLSIESNFGTWKENKQRGKDNFFFVETDENSSYEMTVKDAKGLIEYLQQKIDYLEEK